VNSKQFKEEQQEDEVMILATGANSSLPAAVGLGGDGGWADKIY